MVRNLKSRFSRLKLTIGVVAVAVLLFASFSACASLHQAHHAAIMRGAVLSAVDGEILLCIGSRDGAQAGQELKAYEYVRSTSQRGTGFTRRQIGVVRITEIVDEHFARASVVSGSVKENAIVELD